MPILTYARSRLLSRTVDDMEKWCMVDSSVHANAVRVAGKRNHCIGLPAGCGTVTPLWTWRPAINDGYSYWFW